MVSFDDPTFLRQIIMDHYENPRNKRVESSYAHAHMSTDSCIDDLLIQAKITDGVIEDIVFEGTACTIATSSTSIMTELLKGKTMDETQGIINTYNDMIQLKPFNQELLQEAVAFQNVGRQANRITCATLGWRGIVQIMEMEDSKHE